LGGLHRGEGALEHVFLRHRRGGGVRRA
jgi:hypothetical protein